MNRALKLTGLLAAALLVGACERQVDNVGDYDPALDGPSTPPAPLIASAFLDGKAGGGGEVPAAPKPTPVPTATATAPGDTAASAPATNPAIAPVEAASAADSAKVEIDGRLDQMKQFLTDGKYDEYERAGFTPEEWKAKTDKDAQAFQKEVDSDKADPAKATATLDAITKAVKAAKPTMSADNSLATYQAGPAAPLPVLVFKKVDGLWYFSEVETTKATATPPAAVPAAPAPPAP